MPGAVRRRARAITTPPRIPPIRIRLWDRVLPKHVNRPPTHVEGLLSISMQRAPDAMGVRVNDVGAISTKVYGYARDLAKALEDGADVGLVGVRRETRDCDGRCRGGGGGVCLGGFLV